jgi:hypothetical protein
LDLGKNGLSHVGDRALYVFRALITPRKRILELARAADRGVLKCQI